MSPVETQGITSHLARLDVVPSRSCFNFTTRFTSIQNQHAHSTPQRNRRHRSILIHRESQSWKTLNQRTFHQTGVMYVIVVFVLPKSTSARVLSKIWEFHGEVTRLIGDG